MVLQLEDSDDILQYFYLSFELVYLFDNSNGHNKVQYNGLNINKISVRFGGKQ